MKSRQADVDQVRFDLVPCAPNTAGLGKLAEVGFLPFSIQSWLPVRIRVIYFRYDIGYRKHIFSRAFRGWLHLSHPESLFDWLIVYYALACPWEIRIKDTDDS